MSSISIAGTLAEHRSIDSMGACSCGKNIAAYGSAEREKSRAHMDHLANVLEDRLKVDQCATVEETCGCGAHFRIDTWHGSALDAVSDWRSSHRHVENVGACGDLAPPLDGMPEAIARPACALSHGHAGMHGDGYGAHWTDRPETEDAR